MNEAMSEEFRIQTRDVVGQHTARSLAAYMEARIKDHGCDCRRCQVLIRLDSMNGMLGALAGGTSMLMVAGIAGRGDFANYDTLKATEHGIAIGKAWMRDCEEKLHEHLLAEGIFDEEGHICED